MSTTFQTVVNFSLLDVIHRLNRLQLINEAPNDIGDLYCFPREENRKMGHGEVIDHEFPSDEEVSSILQHQQNVVIENMQELGIDACKGWCIHIDVIPVECETLQEDSNDCFDLFPFIEEQTSEPTTSAQVEIISDDLQHLPELRLDNINFKDYSNIGPQNDLYFRNGKFVKIRTNSDKIMVIKKSSLCWLFKTSNLKLSSNRIDRVKQSNVQKMKTRKNIDLQQYAKGLIWVIGVVLLPNEVEL